MEIGKNDWQSFEAAAQSRSQFDNPPYTLLANSLIDDFSTDMVAFGVVVDANSIHPQSGGATESSSLDASSQSSQPGTVFYAGMLNVGLSSAFPFVGDMVQRAGEIMSGALKKVNGKQKVSAKTMEGVMRQISQAAQMVEVAKEVNNSLNRAYLDVLDNILTVSDIAESVLNVGYDVGEFSVLVNRMSRCVGAKPTPTEEFVQMITKKDALGATMM